jgi:phenylacetate-CoA ligase
MKHSAGARPRTATTSRTYNSLLVAAAASYNRVVPYRSSESIARLQRRRAGDMVAYAYENVPFYRDVMRAEGLRPAGLRQAADLARLPLIDAARVQEDPEYFTSRLHGPGRRWGFHTSGSTAGIRRLVLWDNRGILLHTAYDAARPGSVISRLAGERWVGTVFRTVAADRIRLRRLLAMALGPEDEHRRLSIMPREVSSRNMRALADEQMLGARRTGHVLLSPGEGFDRAVDVMRRERPRVVFSFGSYADQFLRTLHESGCAVPMPRVWVYAGDMVSPLASELAAERGCALYSVYSSAEAGTIGYQCERRSGFHLNVDRCPVRIVDDDGHDVPAGRSGEIVISNLDNRAMVLLNFRTGDRGALSIDPCPCGRNLPVLAGLEGRTSETVVLHDGRRLSSLSVEGLFRHALTPTRQTQLEQVAPGRLHWRVVPFGQVDPADLERAIVGRAAEVLGPGTTVTVEFVDRIDPSARGKIRRVLPGPGPG